MTPDLRTALWEAVQALAGAPEDERTLTGLCLLLQSPALKAALHPFTLEGPHGRLLDGDSETLRLADIVCFEMEDLMQAPGAALPVMTWLFHRLEERFNGRPTLLILDEAWLFLDHPVFAAQLRNWLKTLRKKNVSVIFATQSVADIEAASIAPALTESCRTRIFLPNERALEPAQAATYRRFGLNDRQIGIISQAIPKRDYYFTSPAGCRLFDLGLGPVGLAFCAAASAEDQVLAGQAPATEGGETFARDFLAAKDLAWAAELLALWPGPPPRAPAPAGTDEEACP